MSGRHLPVRRGRMKRRLTIGRRRRPSFLRRVEATMKSGGTESRFELLFTRTPGYLFALLFRRIGATPTTITLLSITLGVASGWFMGQDGLQVRLGGIVLLIVANWLDCADGQLARMTKHSSLSGRILDGFAGDLWFFSIYFFLCLRLQATWGPFAWLAGAWAGMRCHARQCALADYYRNVHIFLLSDGRDGEWDNSTAIATRAAGLKWSEAGFEKLYLTCYARYTRSQERMTPGLQQFRRRIMSPEGPRLPEVLREKFRCGSQRLMPACNALTFDARAIILYLSVAWGKPWLFLIAEATLFEALRHYTRRRHERLVRGLSEKLRCHA